MYERHFGFLGRGKKNSALNVNQARPGGYWDTNIADISSSDNSAP